MKSPQLQKQIITGLTKKKKERWLFNDVSEGVTAIFNPYHMYFIRDKDLYLNTDRLQEGGDSVVEVVKELENNKDLQQLEFVETKKTHEKADPYSTYAGKDLTVHVNPKYLKYFEEPELYAVDDTGGVLVYELGELVGFVLPIRIGNKEKK